jgi:hypothetical protein
MNNNNSNKEYDMVADFITRQKAMRQQLRMITRGNFIKGELLAYVDVLLQTAKPVPEKQDAVSWGFDAPGNMPSDARVDFFFIPTYISCAILIYAAMNYPEEIKRFDAFNTILTNGLITSTFRNFEGHGYDGPEECRAIFKSVGVNKFLEEHPEICPQFTDLWNKKMLTNGKEQ